MSLSNFPVVPNPGWPGDAETSNPEACKWAGAFFAGWMSTNEQLESGIYPGPGVVATANYLRTLFGEAGKQLTEGELVKWYFDKQAAVWNDRVLFEQYLKDYIQPAVTYCGGSVCKALGWTGNSDLAGIGVLASYYIEAVLSSIFLLALLINGTKKTAFHTALPDLVLGVFAFSFAVMAASLYAILVSRNDPSAITTYDVTTGVLVTVFSVCPATLLYCQNENLLDDDGDKDRNTAMKWMFRVVLFVLWVFMLVVVNLGLQSDPSKEALAAGKLGNPFEMYCQVIGAAPLQAVRGFAVVAAGLGAVWTVYVVCSNDDKGGKGKIWPAVVSVMACVAMWVFLASFTVLRTKIIDVAGDSDKSNEWGFGQIIALASWVPLILRTGYLLLVGDDSS